MSEQLKCPACGTRMAQVVHQEATVDQCAFCEGIWFDASELDKLLGQADRAPLEQAIPPRGISGFTCPRCRPAAVRLMAAAGWAGILLDRCPSCRGLFVDAPEFKALKRDGAPPPGPPALEQALQSAGHSAGAALLGLEGFWYFLLSLFRKR